ncbi:extracellular calcium-sensing receptor [Xenopus tropicalis]|uniref:Extracellular calcium-sensing receptor n=1 Tax=Xenopus tropicalis TaxID=8364 RepID=A0A8J1IQ34_XENTR|nr:extracellular calcium-sensing receptor [Xenopus tropicalis]
MPGTNQKLLVHYSRFTILTAKWWSWWDSSLVELRDAKGRTGRRADNHQPGDKIHSRSNVGAMVCPLLLLLIPLPFVHVLGQSGCLLSPPTLTAYTEEGDVTLGLIVPINTISSRKVLSFKDRPAPPQCDLFRRDQYKSILALLFAIEEVNKDPHLLPNVTLGFHMLDSCFAEDFSLRATLQAVTGNNKNAPNFKLAPRICPTWPRLCNTCPSVSQVSYAASFPSLSNKVEFPSFLRTIVSTEGQPYALVELCKTFGWNWIGVLISSTDYAVQGGVVFKREAAKNGICIAYYETIALETISQRIPSVMKNVRGITATAIVLFCSPAEVSAILTEALQQNVTGKIWIGVEAWFTSPVFFKPEFWNLLNGTIGISRSRRILPYFPQFLQDFYPSRYPRMLNIQQFWERTFNCKWTSANGTLGPNIKACTGSERLITDDITEYNDPVSQYVYMAHSALFALANALHDLMACRPGEGPFSGGSCANKQDFQQWQLLYYLKKVQFVNTAGELVAFDVNGDSYGYFDILNWRLDGNLTSRYVNVGTFNNYMNSEQKLSINASFILWADGLAKVPSSVCTESCPPGYRKAPRTGQPLCCFDCVLCPDGMISTQINSIDCTSCPLDQWPNSERNQCLPKVIEYLSYQEPLGLVLALVSMTFSLMTVAVLCVFLRFRDTVIVKANNRSLSYVLLLSLTFCFLSSLTFIGSPTAVTCSLRQSIFGVIFSLCVSCILAKTIIVVMAFKATRPDSRLRQWVSSKTTVLVVSLSTMVQVILIALWLIISPPFLEHTVQSITGKVLLECNEGSSPMFYSVLGYLGFLAFLSFVVAFLARSLPDNFNEAKYITFSMLIFLSVWVSFIPAHLSTKGKYIVATEAIDEYQRIFSLIKVQF